MNNKVLKRFIKDYKLPIQVVKEPYFEYFIDLYDKDFNTKEKLKMLENTLNKFETEKEFLDEYYKIRDNIIKTIENTEEYKDFNTMKLEKFNIPNKGYPANDIFNMNNVGKYFISIDLKKANFQALKYFNMELVLNCETYEELIERFTDKKTFDYFKDSKYLRQVIFGNMNCKRQMKIERYMTQQILDFILEEKLLEESCIKMVSNDEIIFEINYPIQNEKINNQADELVEIIKEKLNFEVDIEVFKLEAIKKYFVKKFINKQGYELMCVPAVYFSQVYKIYNNMPINDNDLLFFYENQVCRFLNPLDFEGQEDGN